MKSANFWPSKLIFYVKNHKIFLKRFIEEHHFRGTFFFVIDIFRLFHSYMFIIIFIAKQSHTTENILSWELPLFLFLGICSFSHTIIQSAGQCSWSMQSYTYQVIRNLKRIMYFLFVGRSGHFRQYWKFCNFLRYPTYVGGILMFSWANCYFITNITHSWASAGSNC